MIKEYEKYKDSGHNWLGTIPEKWNVVKLKYLTTAINTGRTPPTSIIEYFENGDIDWFTPGDFKNLILESAKRKITKRAVNELGLKLFPQKSLLMVGNGATLGEIGLANSICYSNQQINCIIFNNKIESRFGLYFFNAHKEIVKKESNSAILNQNQIKNLYLTLPTIKEQTQIANYLDYKTDLIETVIQKKEALIQKLKEQRRTIINEAVTKGVTSSAVEKPPMKDSGIEWLGKIPEHWEVVKLKYNAQISFSSVDRHEYEDEIKVSICHYPNAYKNEKIKITTDLSKGTCTESEFDKYQLKKGQVIITKDSESANDIGVPTYITETFKNAVCGYHLAILKTDESKLLGEYLFRFLQTQNVRSFFETNANGVTRFGLGKAIIQNLYVPISNMTKQKEIVEYINLKTEVIDNASNEIKEVIKKLKSYRQSVISEAVTGKIDVREWQPPTR